MLQSIFLVAQVLKDVNLDISMSFTNEDKKRAHKILKQSLALLEEQSIQFHQAIKDILEQIVFHREQIRQQERDIYIARIQNFQQRMEEFNQEYKRMLREPKRKRMI